MVTVLSWHAVLLFVRRTSHSKSGQSKPKKVTRFQRSQTLEDMVTFEFLLISIRSNIPNQRNRICFSDNRPRSSDSSQWRHHPTLNPTLGSIGIRRRLRNGSRSTNFSTSGRARWILRSSGLRSKITFTRFSSSEKVKTKSWSKVKTLPMHFLTSDVLPLLSYVWSLECLFELSVLMNVNN